MDSWLQAAAEMVDSQLVPRGIIQVSVLEAMRSVPRHRFVPDEYRTLAYSDCALPIGNGQTISQPYMVARMTELLDLNQGDRVLEVGTGSGYQAAVLSEMGMKVVSIERIAQLAQRASALMEELGYHVQVLIDDGRSGYEKGAPFNGIIVTAAASRVEPPWFSQLADGGRLMVPLRVSGGMERLLLRNRTGKGYLDSWFDYCQFVPVLPGVVED
ncbi:MAG: protein-L-isoaspartate(D-aspartate) O-methyltransferase [Synergistales bacterium]|nr:protein-L-isoaspartate(D-aspartate) O-methyltransferase [Synergistales bacterium]